MKYIAIIAALLLSACGSEYSEYGMQRGEGFAVLLDMVVTESSESGTH